MEDPRKSGLKKGLRQLTIEQLQRVIDYPIEQMVLDTYNYQDGKFCPLAIAVKLDKTMLNPTHEKVFDSLISSGYQVYNTRGIIGDFYTNNRQEDLLIAAMEVLQEKKTNNSMNCPSCLFPMRGKYDTRFLCSGKCFVKHDFTFYTPYVVVNNKAYLPECVIYKLLFSLNNKEMILEGNHKQNWTSLYLRKNKWEKLLKTDFMLLTPSNIHLQTKKLANKLLKLISFI